MVLVNGDAGGIAVTADDDADAVIRGVQQVAVFFSLRQKGGKSQGPVLVALCKGLCRGRQ